MRVRHTRFEALALLGVLAFAAFLISRYDICFYGGESSTVIDRAALRDGVAPSFRDFVTALDITGLEWNDSRPRVISRLAFVWALKTRLALWTFVPPHPSFSPIWLLSFTVGPFLLFKFLEMELHSRAGAFAGVAVYLVSPGFLSGVTMFLAPQKPLANLVIIGALYLASVIHRSVGPMSRSGAVVTIPPRRQFVGYLALLGIAPFIDETAAFALAILPLWCPQLFWVRAGRKWRPRTRTWLIYFIPVAVDAVIILTILPIVTRLATGGHFNLLRFMAATAWRGAWQGDTFVFKFDLHHIVWNATNLLVPMLLPWRVAHITTPVADPAKVPWLVALGLVVGLAIACWAVLRREIHAGFCRKMGGLTGLFVMFQSFADVFHLQELAPTGFYFGALFSIMFAAMAALVYTDMLERSAGIGRLATRAALTWILTISAANFIAINASFIAHNIVLALDFMDQSPAYGTTGDWRPLEARRDEVRRLAQASESIRSYATDVVPTAAADNFAEVMFIWRRWRAGDASLPDGRPVAIRSLWLLTELHLKGQR